MAWAQAREYLFWRLHGVQHTTPVALMTSDAKGNHGRVRDLLAQLGHFGRGAHSFRWAPRAAAVKSCFAMCHWLPAV